MTHTVINNDAKKCRDFDITCSTSLFHLMTNSITSVKSFDPATQSIYFTAPRD